MRHPRLGRKTAGIIRCLTCTTRLPPYDRNTLKRHRVTAQIFELNAAEARRVKRATEMIIAITLAKDVERLSRIDPEFVGTDRVMRRWAVGGPGTGLPAENPDIYRQALPPPLDARTQEIVADVLRESPPGIRTFAIDWYASEIPIDVMRDKAYYSRRGLRRPGRHLSERSVYREWHSVLRYLRFKFERSRHHDLVTLIRSLP